MDNKAYPLLNEFVARYAAQPATAFWRAIEIGMLVDAIRPCGLGLDLGCGDGILTDIIFRKINVTPKLVGIDPDPLETDAAKRFSFYDRVHTCTGNDIPENDDSFDYVISNSVLEHIDNIDETIREVGRVLKPGGQFYFTVPSNSFHENLYGSLIGNIDRQTYLQKMDRRLAHAHYFSSEQWSALLARFGLSLDQATGYLNQAETRRWETLSRFTGGLLYDLVAERHRPIEIQRTLQLRKFQNNFQLPSFFSKTISKIITFNMKHPTICGKNSCLLLIGHK